MFDELWFTKIEPTILTRLQYYLAEMPNAPFPDLVCTTTKRNLTETEEAVTGQFPTLYLYVNNAEIGNDLGNESVNGVRCTVQITVYDNVSKEHCEEISTAALMILKSMRFSTPKMPLTTEYKNIYLSSSMNRRIFGAGDGL